MLDNTRSQSFDTLPGKSESPTALDHCVLRHHSADPFACPCCANVFAETLRLAKVDLAEQAKRTPSRPDRLAPTSLAGDRCPYHHYECRSTGC